MTTAMSKHLLRLLGVFALLLLFAAPTMAQNSQFRCEDEADRLDCVQIETAARPLLDRGAVVAVYMARRGDSSGADFLQRLRADGLAAGDTVDAGLVAVYVSLDPRYAELRGGDRWNEALLTNDNITTIRTSKLVPSLAAGEFTKGYVETLRAIDASIATPPQPGQPPTVGASGTDTTPLAWSVFGVAALAGGGYGAFRWRKAWQARSQARWYAQDAKQAAAEAIVELDRALQASRAKAEYDALSYAAADVERLATTYATVEATFAQVQSTFAATGERLLRDRRPPIADFETAANGYKQIAQQIAGLRTLLAENDQIRQELDALAAQAPAAIEQAKARLSEATKLLDPLAAVIADRGGVLAPIQEQIAQAEAALASRDARRALELSHATADMVAGLGATVETYSTLQTKIVRLHEEAAILERQGYRVQASHAALGEAESALDAGVAALEREGSEAATAPLANVAPVLEQAAARGRGMLDLRAENEARLLDLGIRALAVTTLLTEARQKFDIVDEFAETTWSDIRGNGSEAETSAAEAESLWQRALGRNSIASQEFDGAREDLNGVENALARATNLCEAIIQRLRDLEHARSIAQAELEAAAADLVLAATFLAEHNPDIGPRPEEQIAKANGVLSQAQSEAAAVKPDWLALVRLAQAANSEADAALAGARSEVEAMDKLRAQLASARQVASTELQRAQRFLDLHRGDIGWSSIDQLQSLRDQLQQAESAAHQAEQLAEEERRNALRNAHSQFTSAETRAQQVYTLLYQEFQRAELARQAAAEEERRRSSSSSSWSSSSGSSHSWSSSSSSSSSSRGSSSGGSWGGGSKSGGGW